MPDRGVRDRLSLLYEMRMEKLSQQLVNGELSLSDWQRLMKQELRDLHGMQIVAAAGGNPSDVAPEDWFKVNQALDKQYEYLANFAKAIKDGDVEGAALINRSGLYAGSGKETYWQQAMKDVALPAYPGDGSSECGGRCGCEWVDNKDGSYTWSRHKDDSCDTCLTRAKEWNPYWPEGNKTALETSALWMN